MRLPPRTTGLSAQTYEKRVYTGRITVESHRTPPRQSRVRPFRRVYDSRTDLAELLLASTSNLRTPIYSRLRSVSPNQTKRLGIGHGRVFSKRRRVRRNGEARRRGYHRSWIIRGPVPGQQPSDPPPAITAENPEDEEWEIERVLDSRKAMVYGAVGWSQLCEHQLGACRNLENASEVVADFHHDNPAKPTFEEIHSSNGHVRRRQSRYKKASAQVFSHWVSCALRACQNWPIHEKARRRENLTMFCLE
jgi:hypothetical protein